MDGGEAGSRQNGTAVASSRAQELRCAATECLVTTFGKDPRRATARDWLAALQSVVRERLARNAAATARATRGAAARQVNYLSMEFLLGRALHNGLLALGLLDDCRAAMRELGHELDEILAYEPDAGLGNGGLGRLAACFLDSLATLSLPAFGYGIRYEQGLFIQRISDGWQAEHPDDWLSGGSPFVFDRPEIRHAVRFGGRVERGIDGRPRWVAAEEVVACTHDVIIPGYETDSVSTLRLFSAHPQGGIDLASFSRGDHVRALEARIRAENISRILYPDDSTHEGRELRLRQEYFLTSAAMQDVLRRHIEDYGALDNLADKAAVHLNDTHPALAVPELMRLLVDEHHLDWDRAWSMCSRIFSYTNHTLMPEALETWPVGLLGSLLPRHLEIIYEINHRFLSEVRRRYGDDNGIVARVSVVDESHGRRVRMAHLSIVASHKVNGVSQLHSRLMRETIFSDFAALHPDRFTNQTNGITPRRWLAQANPELATAIDARIGESWRRDLDHIGALRALADDERFQADFAGAKWANKLRLADFIRDEVGISVDPQSLFDVQVKRIHEYKRQLLNVLGVVARYNAIVAAPRAAWTPRTVVIAGKAAPGYAMAKLIIKVIHDVAKRINGDPQTRGLLNLVFVPNYSVSAAELIIPGADLSQQISTAGMEASGTGNMKLALNGALTLGTEDGANIEMRDAVGSENIVIFGNNAAQARELRATGYDPWRYYCENPALRQALDQIAQGFFSPDDPSRFRPLVDKLLWHGDEYLLCADFSSYVAAQARVDALWSDRRAWNRMAILNVAGMGPFSSDRTIRGYAEEIWRLKPIA